MRDNRIVASAADTGHSTASPTANSASTRGAGGSPSLNLNPIAHEAQVIATGARPGDGTGNRELFTETTSTVLVFENGAVIRLAAAVAPGQLLFLTNKETKREVVAQVTRKRDFRPTNCYVELEFTEPAPGFWGIEFPEAPVLVPANVQQKEAAELVRSAPATADNRRTKTPAPDAQEVQTLKSEVEALREQLKLLQTQAEAAKAAAAPSTVVSDPPSATVPADVPNEQPPKLPLATTETVTSSIVAAPRASAALPIDDAEPAFSGEALLPKPALDFNQAKAPVSRPSKPQGKARTSSRPGKAGIGLLSAALLLVSVGGAWYMHWIPWLSPSKGQLGRASAGPQQGTNVALPAHPTPQPVLAVRSDAGSPTSSSDAAARPLNATSLSPGKPTVPAGDATSSTLSAAEPDSSGETAAEVPVAEKPVFVPSAAKHSLSRTSSAAAGGLSTSSLEERTTVPPKLIKSVQAIASTKTLQYFDRGNTATVTLDAMVDASGHVKSMKALSGPASLHDAAMDALKQYRYEPAKQRGKPVSAHVTVTIKFLFEP